MKKYSQTRMFLEYILIAFGSYLIISLGVALIGGYNYRSVLCAEGQIAAVIFLYWWIPVFRMIDMSEANDQ